MEGKGARPFPRRGKAALRTLTRPFFHGLRRFAPAADRDVEKTAFFES